MICFLQDAATATLATCHDPGSTQIQPCAEAGARASRLCAILLKKSDHFRCQWCELRDSNPHALLTGARF